MSRTYKHKRKYQIKKLEYIDSQDDWNFIYPPSKNFKKGRNRGSKAKVRQKIKNGNYEIDPVKKSHRYQWHMDW